MDNIQPTKSQQAPTKEAVVESQAPTQEAVVESQAPTQEASSPTQEASSPTQEASSPTPEASAPTPEASAPTPVAQALRQETVEEKQIREIERIHNKAMNHLREIEFLAVNYPGVLSLSPDVRALMARLYVMTESTRGMPSKMDRQEPKMSRQERRKKERDAFKLKRQQLGKKKKERNVLGHPYPEIVVSPETVTVGGAT